MGSILQNYDPITRVILQILLNSLWQGLVIAILVSTVFRMKQSMSATTRHAVWFVSLLTIGVLPFLPITARRNSEASVTAVRTEPRAVAISTQQVLPSDLPVENARTVHQKSRVNQSVKHASEPINTSTLDISPVVASPPNDSKSNVETPATIDNAPKESRFSRLSEKIFDGRVPLALIGLWGLITLYMFARIASSYVLMVRMRMNMKPLPDHSRHLMKRTAVNFDFKRHVRVRMSRTATVPMTIGMFKPLIVIPEELISSLSDAEFEGVIAHELAHIKRWDYLTNILQHIIQAYLFFHPAVWLIGKYLNVERELACDDWAVKVTGEPCRYATCLTRLVEELKGSKPLAIATGIFFGKHIISRRVEMILDKNRNASTFIAKPALLYALSVAIVCAGICTLLSPVIAVPAGKIQTMVAQNQSTKPAPAQKTQTNSETTTKPTDQPTTPVVVAKPAAAPLAITDKDFDAEVLVPTSPEGLVVPMKAQTLDLLAPQAKALTVDQFDFQVPTTPVVLTQAVGFAQPMGLVQGQTQPSPALTGDSWAGAQQGRAALSTDRSATPAISEGELLNVLADVVKRDADPTVRGEALQGIVRLRSDASINTLISLYDSSSDTKVKAEIIPYLVRRKGDNAKAIAKLVSIAKTEKDDELRRSALNQIIRLPNDEAVNSLIEIYDSLQDTKAKQRLIMTFSASKSRKAVDKLIQIAKSDSDPAVRQAAIRALSNVDNRLYIDLSGKGTPMAPPAPAFADSEYHRGMGRGAGVGSGSSSGSSSGQGSSSSTPTRPPGSSNW